MELVPMSDGIKWTKFLLSSLSDKPKIDKIPNKLTDVN